MVTFTWKSKEICLWRLNKYSILEKKGHDFPIQEHFTQSISFVLAQQKKHGFKLENFLMGLSWIRAWWPGIIRVSYIKVNTKYLKRWFHDFRVFVSQMLIRWTATKCYHHKKVAKIRQLQETQVKYKLKGTLVHRE